MMYPEAFLASLPVMAKGMAGIFIVTLAIILSIVLLNGVMTLAAGRRSDVDKR